MNQAELSGMETVDNLITNVLRVSMDRSNKISQLESQNHELVRRIAKLRMQNRIMKRALNFYGDAGNIRHISMIDRGAKAREALK